MALSAAGTGTFLAVMVEASVVAKLLASTPAATALRCAVLRCGAALTSNLTTMPLCAAAAAAVDSRRRRCDRAEMSVMTMSAGSTPSSAAIDRMKASCSASRNVSGVKPVSESAEPMEGGGDSRRHRRMKWGPPEGGRSCWRSPLPQLWGLI